jgi:multiple sugar transport system ATP-binding protein
MAEVVLDKINKQYEYGFHAVKDLDLDIADGEFLVLVGPSGCGKTTALRMVAGLEDISSGTMRIGGRVVNTMSSRDRDIAMVFQSYALYPHMSVADNISYGLRLRRMDKAEIDRRAKRAADMLELGPLLDRKPKQLSGGQRQRVAMGRAIVREPQVPGHEGVGAGRPRRGRAAPRHGYAVRRVVRAPLPGPHRRRRRGGRRHRADAFLRP